MRLVIIGLFLTAMLASALPPGSFQPEFAAAQDDTSDGASENLFNTSAGPIFTLPQWNDGGGWTEPEYYSTIQLADIDGDGADELLARGPGGMIVEKWDSVSGYNLWNQIVASGPFDDDGGWNRSQYYSTIQLADIDGDGAAELLGRGKSGIYTYSWNGTSWSQLSSASPAWSNDSGWDSPEYYATIHLADIDGDGAAELLARDTNGIETYEWAGSGWSRVASGSPAWSDAAGWNRVEYYSTIQTGDINGDGAAELLARSSTGIESYRWNGSAWNLIKAGSPAWTDATDWDRPQYYLTIQTADVDGDGRAELIGRSSAGINTFHWNGTSWQLLKQASPGWDDGDGWNNSQYYLTIQTGDIDGDGAYELLARSATGMDTYEWSDGDWSAIATNNPGLSDDHWQTADNYLTIRTGDVNGDGDADLVARGLYGVRTWSWNEVTANAWDNPVAYGLPAFTGDQLAAYEYVGSFLKITSGQTVRDQYPSVASGNKLQPCLFTGANDNAWNDWTEIPTETCFGLATAQEPITPPSGLTLEAWNTVAEQIYIELGQAASVSTYFNNLTDLYAGIFADNDMILTSTALTLFGEDMTKQKVKAFWQSLFLSPFKLSPLGGPIASAVGATASALISAGISATSSDPFEGTWAEAQSHYTTLTEQNEDAFAAGHAFVAGDATLMSYVALQSTSGAWNPADDWVTRYTSSEGRQAFALWIFQTLAPAVWDLRWHYWESVSQCHANRSSIPEGIQNYYADMNDIDACWAEIRSADSAVLETILTPIESTCIPTMQDDTTKWEYGCKLGIAKTSFFLNRDGWNFHLSCLREDTATTGCSSGAEMAIQPGSSSKAINQSDPGVVQVAILGSEQFDATNVAVDSLELAGASPAGWWVDEVALHPSRIRDVNSDGFDDVVVSFPIQDLDLEAGKTTVMLTGQMLDGTWFVLWDTVDVIPAVQ